MTTFVLQTPPDFGFDATVRSHGWFDLPPFRYGADRVLRTAVELEAGAVAALRIDEPAPGTIRVRFEGEAARDRVERLARAMLQVDQDLAPLHALLARRGGRWAWVRARGAGRLLRAPTAFEDAVKVLLTTNCSWAATRGMARRLVFALGTPAAGAPGLRAFPRPERLAAQPLSFYRERVRAGYRAEALLDLSRAAASGALAIEGWRAPERPTEELRREILSVRGFGPYAADQVLRLAGRFDRPALDSWMREKWRRLHPRSRLSEREVLGRYARWFGEWAGLALWLDLTRDWHSPDGTDGAAGAERPWP